MRQRSTRNPEWVRGRKVLWLSSFLDGQVSDGLTLNPVSRTPRLVQVVTDNGRSLDPMTGKLQCSV